MAERRKVPRYIAELEGRITQPPHAQGLPVKVMNLSVLGCSLEGSGLLKPTDDCELAIEWEGRQFRAQAAVTWKSSKGEAGLKFLDLDPANQALLKKICATLRLQPLVQLPEDSA